MGKMSYYKLCEEHTKKGTCHFNGWNDMRDWVMKENPNLEVLAKLKVLSAADYDAAIGKTSLKTEEKKRSEAEEQKQLEPTRKKKSAKKGA